MRSRTEKAEAAGKWYIRQLFRKHNLTQVDVAERLGITKQAVHKWCQVPAERVVWIEKMTGIPREELRPDLYQ